METQRKNNEESFINKDVFMKSKEAKMKKTLSVLLVILAVGIIALIIALSVNNNTSIEQGDIKIGIVGHFSGEYASYGVPMKNAVELAVEEVNNQGGIDGRQIKLLIEDDGADATKAASAMNKLINIDNVDYIISAQGSGATSVVSPIAQDNKRILMITLGSSPDLAKIGDYIFRSVPSDVYQATEMVKVLNGDLKSKKVAGLYINNAYGVGIRDIVDKSGKVTINEMFEPGSADFRTQLLKIKEADVDTMVLVCYKEECPLILKQANDLNLNINILASETFKDEEILSNSGSYAEGVYVMFMEEPQDYVDFTENYKNKFGVDPSAYSMYAYDGATALIEAIDKVKDNVDGVKNKLYSISFNGASGSVGFDEDGDRTGSDYTIYVVENGKFVLY